jgi:hypothetical protein
MDWSVRFFQKLFLVNRIAQTTAESSMTDPGCFSLIGFLEIILPVSLLLLELLDLIMIGQARF